MKISDIFNEEETKATCLKCNKELRRFETSQCYDCKKKEDRNATIFGISVLILVFCIFMGIKYAWAIYAYNDWRCMLSECRIIK